MHIVWVLDKVDVHWAWENWVDKMCINLPKHYTHTVTFFLELMLLTKRNTLLEQRLLQADIIYVFYPIVADYLVASFAIDPKRIVLRLSGVRGMLMEREAVC